MSQHLSREPDPVSEALIRGICYDKSIAGKNCKSLLESIAEHDAYTYQHSFRVARHSGQLAEEMDMSKNEISDIVVCALFHDIGKLNIPLSILTKPGRLTTPEMSLMTLHPVFSYDILRNDFSPACLNTILCHHERLDGLGYPNGVSGDSIPVASQIIGIADTYDAMTSTRPYRLAMSPVQALNCIAEECEHQFDKELIAAMRITIIKATRAILSTVNHF